jgi:hypothetical protein
LRKKSCFHTSFATEEICSASLVVENVQFLPDLSPMGRKNKEFFFFMAKFFASGGEMHEWKTGVMCERFSQAEPHSAEKKFNFSTHGRLIICCIFSTT